MPLTITKGTSSSAGFGRGAGGGKEPPGSYTFPNGFSGASYQPIGYDTVTLTLYGSNGNNGTSRPMGSTVIKNSVPVDSLQIYCPVGFRQSQWPGGGNGGFGGSTSVSIFKGLDGGAVTAATWGGGGLMVAAGGGGGASISMGSRTTRLPAAEGNGGNGTIPGSGNNGGNGQSGACYYGGGGGGGGHSVGGSAGSTNRGGNAGGNFSGTPSPSGPGSFGYDTIITGSVGTAGFAKIEWS